MFTKAFSPFLFIFLILLLVSCAASESQAPDPKQEEMLNPGNKIGEWKLLRPNRGIGTTISILSASREMRRMKRFMMTKP